MVFLFRRHESSFQFICPIVPLFGQFPVVVKQLEIYCRKRRRRGKFQGHIKVSGSWANKVGSAVCAEGDVGIQGAPRWLLARGVILLLACA